MKRLSVSVSFCVLNRFTMSHISTYLKRKHNFTFNGPWTYHYTHSISTKIKCWIQYLSSICLRLECVRLQDPPQMVVSLEPIGKKNFLIWFRPPPSVQHTILPTPKRYRNTKTFTRCKGPPMQQRTWDKTQRRSITEEPSKEVSQSFIPLKRN